MGSEANELLTSSYAHHNRSWTIVREAHRSQRIVNHRQPVEKTSRSVVKSMESVANVTDLNLGLPKPVYSRQLLSFSLRFIEVSLFVPGWLLCRRSFVVHRLHPSPCLFSLAPFLFLSLIFSGKNLPVVHGFNESPWSRPLFCQWRNTSGGLSVLDSHFISLLSSSLEWFCNFEQRYE